MFATTKVKNINKKVKKSIQKDKPYLLSINVTGFSWIMWPEDSKTFLPMWPSDQFKLKTPAIEVYYGREGYM
jgi:hypothetical protein